MIQIPPKTQEIYVNVCKPTYFYNISQRHQFLVYDFRPAHCAQRLKYSLKIDTINRNTDIQQMKSTQQLKELCVPIDNGQERLAIMNLFDSRKRNFNFFLPFEAPDAFTLCLMDTLYKMEEKKQIKREEVNLQMLDYVKVPLIKLQEICREYRVNGPKISLAKMHQEEIYSPQISRSDSSNSESKDYTESMRDLTNISPSSLQHSWSSTPNLSYYNVLDQAVPNIDIFESVLHTMSLFMSDKIREAFMILQPGLTIFEEYPHLDYSKPQYQPFLGMGKMPNEIFEGKLYLGNADHAGNRELLTKLLKITHVVNAAKEVDCKFRKDGVHYMKIDIRDEVTERISDHFDEVYEFIDSVWEQEDKKILVHCAQGRSRSAALVIMFLMRKQQWTLKNALEYVRERREVISLNDGFLSQLEMFEKTIFE